MNAFSGLLICWFCECRRANDPQPRPAVEAAARTRSSSKMRCVESQTYMTAAKLQRRTRSRERDRLATVSVRREAMERPAFRWGRMRDDVELVGVKMADVLRACESVRQSCGPLPSGYSSGAAWRNEEALEWRSGWRAEEAALSVCAAPERGLTFTY